MISQRELSCPTITGSQLQTQQEEPNLTLHPDTTLQFQKKRGFLYTLGSSSANEKPPYYKLPVHSNGLVIYNSLPNLPLSSLKKHASPFIPSNLPGFCQFIGFYFLKILFIYSWKTQREKGRDTGRGRSRLPGGSPMWDSIPEPQDPRITTWSKAEFNHWATQVPQSRTCHLFFPSLACASLHSSPLAPPSLSYSGPKTGNHSWPLSSPHFISNSLVIPVRSMLTIMLVGKNYPC